MTRATIIIIISSIIMIALCVFGGFMMLVMLNGFSEREATPILIGYTVVSLIAIIGTGALTSWLFTRSMPAEIKPQTWATLGLSAAIPLCMLACLIVARLIQNQF